MNEIKKNTILRPFLELSNYENNCPVFDPNSKNRSELKALTTDHEVTEVPLVVKTVDTVEYLKGVTPICSGRYNIHSDTLIDACIDCPLNARP